MSDLIEYSKFDLKMAETVLVFIILPDATDYSNWWID